MAGPLVRVDIDGRGTLLKMPRREAEAYVASHPAASIAGERPAPLSDEAAVEQIITRGRGRGRSTRAKPEPTGDEGDEGGEE